MLVTKRADCYMCNVIHHWKKKKKIPLTNGREISKILRSKPNKKWKVLYEGNIKFY